MAKKKTEVSATNGKALATKAAAPLAKSHGTKIAARGFENLEREDILLPRLSLLQPLSPEVVDRGEKAGTMYINLSSKNIGVEVTVVPVLHYRSRIKWNPVDDGGGIDCRSADAKVPADTKYAHTCAECNYKEWADNPKKKGEQLPPACTLYENFVILIGDSTEPVIFPMAITKVKVAKKFYSMMALKGDDMWLNAYKLKVVQEKNDKGQGYFNFAVQDIGKRTGDKQAAAAEKLWGTLSKANITTEMTPEEAAPKETAAVGAY